MTRHVDKKIAVILLLVFIPLSVTVFILNTSARNNLSQMEENINTLKINAETYVGHETENVKQAYNLAIKEYYEYASRWPASFFVAKSEIIDFQYM